MPKILIIEDDPYAAEILKLILGQMLPNDPPPQITVLPELGSAMPYLIHNEADLAVLDLDLPDSNPANTLNTVVGRFPDIRIVIVSAYISPAVVAQASAAGIPAVDKDDLYENRDLLGRIINEILKP